MKNICWPIFFILTQLFFSISLNAQTREIDSLQEVLRSAKKDTIQINTLKSLADCFYDLGQNEKSLFYSKQALELSEKLNYKKGISISLSDIGSIYSDQANYEKALANFLNSLKVYEELNDQKGIGKIYNNIGLIYMNQGNSDKALENFNKSLKIRIENDDKKGIARSYGNIGNVYQNKSNYEKALEYYFKTLKIEETIGDEQVITNTYINIGNIYYFQGNLDKALDNYSKSLKIKTELGEKQGIANCKLNIGAVYIQQNKFENADLNLQEALRLYKEMGIKDGVKLTYSSLADLYEKKQDYKQAFQYHKFYSDLKDTIFNEASSKQIAEMNTKYDTEKKDKDLIKKDAEINVQHAESAKQQAQRNVFITGFILMLGIAFFILRGYRQKKTANILLETKNETISKQSSEIEKKNLVITDSIEYAQNIQQAILPDDAEIKKQFNDYFILYKPKDIVSGDFYWLHDDNESILFVVADCTGHGVPGAFMSFMGYNLLENIINTSSRLNPSEILEELNDQILHVLKQKTENVTAKFGMDISLISLNKKSKQIEFAGAHNSLLILRGQEITELKADNRTIGSRKKNENKNFINHQFQLIEGDIFYMFTDGYQDQIGGSENKKFFMRPFRELLLANNEKPLPKQKEILEETIISWKGNKNQTDDILVVGIKV